MEKKKILKNGSTKTRLEIGRSDGAYSVNENSGRQTIGDGRQGRHVLEVSLLGRQRQVEEDDGRVGRVLQQQLVELETGGRLFLDVGLLDGDDPRLDPQLSQLLTQVQLPLLRLFRVQRSQQEHPQRQIFPDRNLKFTQSQN